MIAALSLATDLGMDLPLEHGLHSSVFAMRLCTRLGVDAEAYWKPRTASHKPSGHELLNRPVAHTGAPAADARREAARLDGRGGPPPEGGCQCDPSRH
jgi:hypothetical protein